MPRLPLLTSSGPLGELLKEKKIFEVGVSPPDLLLYVGGLCPYALILA